MSENGWKRDGPLWARAGLAGGAGLLTALLLMLLLAVFAADWIVPAGRERLAALAALFLGAVAAGLLACRKNGQGGVRAAAVAAGVMALGLLLLGVFTSEAAPFNMSTLLGLLCVIFGVLIGCGAGLRRPRRHRRRR